MKLPFLKIANENYSMNASLCEYSRSEDTLVYRLSLSSDEKITPEPLKLVWELEVNDVISLWSPRIGFSRYLPPNWRKVKTESRIASGAPVMSAINADGSNACTVAVSDPKSPTEIAMGVSEESALFEANITFFTSFISPIDKYEAYIRFDISDIPFTKAVQNVSVWWEKDFGYTHAYVPKAAKMPMNSAWYSFHQALDPERIIEECKLSAPLGMDTIILDDGWQTDDNNRGYRFCGDWELATKKIPDMKALTDAIHQTGMKVMLWFSVPYVGIYSKAYERFKNKALSESGGVLVVDVRYKEVRDYLVNIYKNAVADYGLDGLKLDFIDRFKLDVSSPAANDEMDISSVEDALDALLEETKRELLKIDPEILIEFRQSYIGPTILKYGNMIRVGDCPYDSLRNRMGIVDLRLTSGNTAVHSDMIMWNKDASVESACLQMISTLFGVPQVSVIIKDLPKDHKKALEFWLGFYRENVEVLHSENISVKNPEMNYSQVKTVKNGSSVAVNYANVPFDVEAMECGCKYSLINSTYENYVCVNALSDLKDVTVTVKNCMGDIQSADTVTLSKGLHMISTPPCGLVEIRK